MHCHRRYKRLTALVTLLLFLSQGIPVFAVAGVHDLHAPQSVTQSHADTRSQGDAGHPRHHEHRDTIDHTGEETPSAEILTEAPCDEHKNCQCCIGSCASVLAGDAGRIAPLLNDALRASTFPYLPSRLDESLYRPPISL